MITIRVNGLPAPQGSKRHVGNGRMVESSRAVGPWREAIRAETQRVLERMAKEASKKTGTEFAWTWPPFKLPTAVAVETGFYFARPASHYGTGRNAGILKPSAPPLPVVKKNDLDKLVRSTLDGLVKGGALADDCQVTCMQIVKSYATPEDPPGAVITISEDTI